MTPRLVIRPQSLDAVRALLDGADSGLALAPGYPHADTFDALHMVLPYAEGEHHLGWFITLAADGRVIGDCGTKGWVDADGRLEIGYGLSAAYRQRGYGTEAVSALVGWLRGRPGVGMLIAEVEVGNVASRRLLERVGFTLESEDVGSWWFALPA